MRNRLRCALTGHQWPDWSVNHFRLYRYRYCRRCGHYTIDSVRR